MVKTFLTLLILVSALSACANPVYAPSAENPGKTSDDSRFKTGQSVSVVWEKLPTEDGFGSFFFRTFRRNPDGTTTFEDIENLAITLWMPSMGHGSSPVTIDHLGLGDYRASKVFFSMRGEWEIRFQIKTGQNVQDQVALPFSF
jgi:hypothetical protein